MPGANTVSGQADRIADRLTAARRGRFVGRESEVALLRAALLAGEPSFAVLFIHGPGGIGKTSLLHAYAQLAADSGRRVIHLDGRSLEPSPPGFLAALQQALDGQDEEQTTGVPNLPHTTVLLLDTYERLEPLDHWLRAHFLPQLPAQSLVVIAGRNPPAPAWRTDLDWGKLTRVLALRNMRPEESKTLLATRGVPAGEHANLLAVTHGHPLMLSLIADALARGDELAGVHLHNNPDIVRTLLERFVHDAPTTAHRLALEICVMAWATTETLLAGVLGSEEAPGIFEWLRSLSFIEQGPQGLFPHDVARDVLEADFRWRNVELHQQLYRQLVKHLYQRLPQAQARQQQRIWFDVLYLARHNPYMRPYFDWNAMGSAYAEAATPEDLPAILAMVEAHEGADSARIAHYWWTRQPQAFLVYRSNGEVIGFMAHLALHRATEEDRAADPALPAALHFVQHSAPAQPGEEIMHVRFWMGREFYQGVSPAINLTAINASIYWSTHPRMAWNFITTADPAYLQPHFTMIKMRRTPEADFRVGGRLYGVFAHDWRVETAADWLELKAQRYGLTEVDLEALEAPDTSQAAPPRPPLMLSEPEFSNAARQALRDYARPDRLMANPLLHSRLVVELESGDALAALQMAIRQAVELLKGNPKDEKLYRALWHTYLQPATTQEQAAEQLDLPFSTYRSHLTAGIDRVVAWLWQRELHDFHC